MRIALFDIDGTLTASNEIDSLCFADAFRDVFGIEIDTNWDAYEHTTDRGIATEALVRAGRDASESALALHRTRFVQLLTSRMRSLDEIAGAGAFLAQLLARDWRIALCTGAWSDSARLKLSRAGLPTDLPLASCDDDISREAILRRGMALAGGGADDIVVAFGDACRRESQTAVHWHREREWCFRVLRGFSRRSRALRGDRSDYVTPGFSPPWPSTWMKETLNDDVSR
jgi:beta-phosphoglucomutase-like phosphatase (HAD superfamily)